MLEEKVEEAIRRIQRDYFACDGKIYLSFSGGKDSTVVAELIKMANLPTEIPFVFANTGIELDATLNFVKEYDYENIHIVKPVKTFKQVVDEYGYPVLSKLKSEALMSYQKHIENPLEFSRLRQFISEQAEKGGEKLGWRSRMSLPTKHFHFLHPDLEYEISNRCCEFMKKKPMVQFLLDNDLNGYYMGVRSAEGGVRQMQYTACTAQKKVNRKKTATISMPIIDWSDELLDEFIEKYNVSLSDAYTRYGMNRTGCIGCPYNLALDRDLEILYVFERNKYNAIMKWMSHVYLDQGIEIWWDENYMKTLKERKKVNEARRIEMLEKFSDIRSWKNRRRIK